MGKPGRDGRAFALWFPSDPLERVMTAMQEPQLPERGEFVIRDAHLVTMDSGLGEIARGSVHVKDGAIVAVGQIDAEGVPEIDARDTICMPGFVDTHWHMWT